MKWLVTHKEYISSATNLVVVGVSLTTLTFLIYQYDDAFQSNFHNHQIEVCDDLVVSFTSAWGFAGKTLDENILIDERHDLGVSTTSDAFDIRWRAGDKSEIRKNLARAKQFSGTSISTFATLTEEKLNGLSRLESRSDGEVTIEFAEIVAGALNEYFSAKRLLVEACSAIDA